MYRVYSFNQCFILFWSSSKCSICPGPKFQFKSRDQLNHVIKAIRSSLRANGMLLDRLRLAKFKFTLLTATQRWKCFHKSDCMYRMYVYVCDMYLRSSSSSTSPGQSSAISCRSTQFYMLCIYSHDIVILVSVIQPVHHDIFYIELA